MATLSDLQARLESLKAALASGALMVQHGDKRTQLRSVEELKAAIAAVEEDIADAGGTRINRTFKFTSSKDL